MGPREFGRIGQRGEHRQSSPRTSHLVTHRYLLVIIALLAFSASLPGQVAPEELLQQANQLAEAGNWVAARPLFVQAEQAFTQMGDRRQALYAKFGRLRRDVETGSYDDYLKEINADLATPEVAADPALRLRGLAVRASIHMNLSTSEAQQDWQEIARIAGLDTVPPAAMPRVHGVTRSVLTEVQKRGRRARRVLAARGFVEAITWSFTPRAWAEAFGGGADALELANPISTEMSSMRPSLLPGLLTAAQRNRNRGFADVALFEVGQAYHGDQPADQLLLASGVRVGASQLMGSGRHWDGAAKPADVFDIKADAAALLAALGVDPARAQITRDAPAWFHPGRSATLRLGPKVVLAHFGEIHPATLKSLDVTGPAAAFEVFVSQLPAERGSRRHGRRSLPPTCSRDADFAFLLDRGRRVTS